MVRIRTTTFRLFLLLPPLVMLPAGCGSDTGTDPPDPNGTVATVQVTPSGAWLVTGDTLRLTATARDAQGAVVEGVAVTWEVSHPSAATVSATGLVEVLDSADVQVTARAAGRTGSASLRLHHGGGRRVPALAAFDSVVLGALGEHRVPGGVLAISYEGRLVMVRAYGFADAVARERMDPDALFRTAGLSKPVTGVTALKLAEDGRLDLDRPVFEMLPELTPPPGQQEDPRLGQVTLRTLLHHVGGWNEELDGDPMVPPLSNVAADMLEEERPPDAETIIRFMRGRPLHADPTTLFRLSNFGYALLGRAIERATGESYEASVRAEVLAPLGIERMRIGRTRFPERLPGEVRYHDATTVNSVFPPHVGVSAPYGGFYLQAMDAGNGWVATAADLLRLVAGVDGRAARPDILSLASRELMLAPPPWPAFSDNAHVGAGGWFVQTGAGETVWMHEGMLPGVTTLVLHSTRGYAYAALFNGNSAPQNALHAAIGLALRQTANAITEWPAHDWFDEP